MPRPLIGVTTQTLQAIDGIPEGLPSSVVMNQRYYHAVAMAGAAPVLIPLLDDLDKLRAIYHRMDGILIPGGVDVDPNAFGESRRERLGRIDPARDRVEIQLAKWAIEDGKPRLPVEIRDDEHQKKHHRHAQGDSDLRPAGRHAVDEKV